MTRFFTYLADLRRAEAAHAESARNLAQTNTRIKSARDEFENLLKDGSASSDDVYANKDKEVARETQIGLAESKERDAAFEVDKVRSDYLLEKLDHRDIPHPENPACWETNKGKRILTKVGREEVRELLRKNRIGGLQPWQMALAIAALSLAVISALLGWLPGNE